jgi:recombination protein RecR
MSGYLENLTAELNKLPGIGEKSAERIAYNLLKRGADENQRLGQLIAGLKEKVHFCKDCGFFTEEVLCTICGDETRDRSQICVVEEPKDVIIFEKLRLFHGLYHVLGGIISPLNGIGPEDLRIQGLLERASGGKVSEVILAFGQTTESDLTGLYLNKKLKELNIKVSKLRAGIPVGSDLEFVDILTLGRSFEGRQTF